MRKRVQRRAAAFALANLLALAFARIGNAQSPVPAAPAAATPRPRPAQIDKNSALILIRTTLVALQQANQTSNYSVLHAISAPGFQNVNSPERLSQIFANLRGKGFDLSGVVVLEPQLSVLPEVYENGVMRMAGFFPSVPMQVYFDLQFVPVQGQWRLLAIGVNIGSPISAPPITDVPVAREAPRVLPAQSVEPKVTPSPSPQPKAAPVVETAGKPKQSPTKSPRP